MTPPPVQCRRCRAVLINGEWVFARPGLLTRDGWLCNVCGPQLEAKQKRDQVRGEKAVARKCERGFGPSNENPFR